MKFRAVIGALHHLSACLAPGECKLFQFGKNMFCNMKLSNVALQYFFSI
jgi:hypothetical protein